MESLTLRDQFAIAALQGEISAQDFKTGDCWNLTRSNDIKQLAERAYEIADAMLAERDKKLGRLNQIKLAAQCLVNNPEEISPVEVADRILGLIEGYGE